MRGYDAAVLSEVAEHVDPPRLPALEYAVFGAARPGTVLVTTPNAEYNVRWESLPAGQIRQGDHRFEWTREEFRDWARGVAGRHGCAVAFAPVGPEDPEVGPPPQMAVFTAAGGPAPDPAPGPAPAPGTAPDPGTAADAGRPAAAHRGTPPGPAPRTAPGTAPAEKEERAA